MVLGSLEEESHIDVAAWHSINQYHLTLAVTVLYLDYQVKGFPPVVKTRFTCKIRVSGFACYFRCQLNVGILATPYKTFTSLETDFVSIIRHGLSITKRCYPTPQYHIGRSLLDLKLLRTSIVD